MSKGQIVIGAVVAIVLLAGLWLLSQAADQARLDRSALGVEGVARLAPDLGLEIVQPRRIGSPKASDLALSIMPLYDLDFDSTMKAPRTRAEQLGQSTLREVDPESFYRKLRALKTLIVLPKWRGGVMVTGVAHQEFLIKPSEFRALLNDLFLSTTQVQHLTTGFVDEQVTFGNTPIRVALFHPQTFARSSLPRQCREIAGLAEGALLISCTVAHGLPAIWLLSDPDIMNNHGLTNGRNADFLLASIGVIERRNETRPIYLDTSSEMLFAPEQDQEAQYYRRDSEQFLRFFKWPLSLLWLAGFGVFAVAVWRGALRFGPVQKVADDRLELSKLAAIDAKARLIRMSKNDGLMVAEYVHARLLRAAEQVFGHGAGDAGIERLYKRFARENPDRADALRTQSQLMLTTAAGMSGPELRLNLERFKELLERLTHGPA